MIDAYIASQDFEAAENANVTYSVQGLNVHVASSTAKEYALSNIYDEEIAAHHIDKLFHIHDLGFLGAYCCGWSLYDLLVKGFTGVPGKMSCAPARHFSSALGQLVNFLFTMQGELAGAQAVSSFDTYLAPFALIDGLSYKEVYDELQGFIYSLNASTRAGFQCPFTNITLDLICPPKMKDEEVIVGGKPISGVTYGLPEVANFMDVINRAFCEIMSQGDAAGNIFPFPIPTYNIWPGFDFDKHSYLWEMTAKYGIPYFANFINSDLSPDDVRSMCCRLRLDLSKLPYRGGGLFGASPLTGSLGVVTLNLPLIAKEAADIDDFYKSLTEIIDIAARSLDTKRKWVEKHMDLYPYCKFYLKEVFERTGHYFTNHFSTIGIIGGEEACENLFGVGIIEKHDWAEDLLSRIRLQLLELQNQYKQIFNLEASPGESVSHRFAQEGSSKKYITNSTQLPVDATSDITVALKHQETLQSAYTGGTVFHAFLGERIKAETAKNLVHYMLSNYRIPYVTITPTFSICPVHKYISGEFYSCPKCAEPCLVYSRIVGYYRPTRQWNEGKQDEMEDRKVYQYIDGKSINGSVPIGSFILNSTIDYPGKLFSSVVFLPGCNLNCQWCHNREMRTDDIWTHEKVIDYMSKQNSEKRNIVISGGEPTIHGEHLVNFLRQLRAKHISIKLDTNGTNPELLQRIIDEGLVDFVAMDIKSSFENYEKVTSTKVDIGAIKSSIALLKQFGHVEFRTTCGIPGVDIEDCMKIADPFNLIIQNVRK